MRRVITILTFALLGTIVAQGQIKIGGNVYGGGNQGVVNGSTKVTVKSGDIGAILDPAAVRPLEDPKGKVFGGARMANVGGNTFVHIDGKSDPAVANTNYILINQVFGGNDIAGNIGTAAAVKEDIPAELEAVKSSMPSPLPEGETEEYYNAVDNTFNSYVRVSTKVTDEHYTEEEIRLASSDPDNPAFGKSTTDVKPAPGSKKKESGLTVEVDAQMVAKIIIPNKLWNGSDEITFTVADPEGATATSKAVFTVNSVNDVPVLKKIPDQMIDEKGEFVAINLAELASDADHEFSQLKWAVTGNKDLKISIDKAGMVTIKTPDPLWNGSEKVTFTVTDPEGASAKSDAVFTVKSINDPPVMKDIASQTIKEKQEFKPIELDKFVEDKDHDKANLKWTFSGQKDLKVNIDNKHVATVKAPSKFWNGSESIKFTVTDPEGATDNRVVTFTAESVNDLPVFTKPIKDQTIQEKREFAIISLNDIVNDPDHKPEQLSWSFDVKPGKGSPKGYAPQLAVTVDDKRMAKIVIPEKNWHGEEVITFTVTDPEGGKASCTATFTVSSVNDAPTIGKIKDQTIVEKASFASINLAELVKDPDHPFEKLKIEVTGNKDLK